MGKCEHTVRKSRIYNECVVYKLLRININKVKVKNCDEMQMKKSLFKSLKTWFVFISIFLLSLLFLNPCSLFCFTPYNCSSNFLPNIERVQDKLIPSNH